MDQNKKGQQQGSQQNWNQSQKQDWNQSQNPNREPAEGQKQHMPGQTQGQGHSRGQGHPEGQTHGQSKPSGMGGQERGKGSKSERNRGGGISNRDMGRELDEQEELPDRGSDQSER